MHCKHGKAVCLLIYLHVNVLFQQASSVIKVLNPMEKCVWSHLWRKNMEMICFEFVTSLICEPEMSVTVWSTWSISSLRSTPVNETCSYDYWRAGLKSPNSIKKTTLLPKCNVPSAKSFTSVAYQIFVNTLLSMCLCLALSTVEHSLQPRPISPALMEN